MASLHLEGSALEWFQGYKARKSIRQFFFIDIVSRFGLSIYDKPYWTNNQIETSFYG